MLAQSLQTLASHECALFCLLQKHSFGLERTKTSVTGPRYTRWTKRCAILRKYAIRTTTVTSPVLFYLKLKEVITTVFSPLTAVGDLQLPDNLWWLPRFCQVHISLCSLATVFGVGNLSQKRNHTVTLWPTVVNTKAQLCRVEPKIWRPCLFCFI
jgi:hypothetical protein